MKCSTLLTQVFTKCLLLGFLALFTAVASAGDLIISNVQGYTLSDQAPTGAQPIRFSSLLIRDGRVVSTDARLIPKIAKADAKTIDGKGRALLPGLIDAHGHLAGLGQMLASVDLRGSQSAADAAARVANFLRDNPQLKNASWINGRGWNQENWADKQFPTSASLDVLKIQIPIVLERVDGHALWLNSVALKLAGITAQTPDPDGGQIIRDAKGKASGVLVDTAMGLVTSKLAKAGKPEQDRQLSGAFDHLLSLGITGVHDAGIDQDTVDLLSQRAQQHKLPLRVYGMLDGSSANLSRWLKAGPITDSEDRLSIRSVKLYADGALGSRGAALLAPYSDSAETSGLTITGAAELQRLFALVDQYHFQLCVHAIGDHANQQVLDAFEQLNAKRGDQGLRHRIEHAQVIAMDDLERFADLNIIASMQPTHATSDMHMAEARLGGERLSGAYAWRTLLNRGVRLAGGSDFPVESANPFFGIHAAVTRQDHQDKPSGGWRAQESLTLAEALSLFTRDAAYAGHSEQITGTLESGKWADFILLDRNPFTIAPSELKDVQVEQTWVAGKRVFQRAQ